VCAHDRAEREREEMKTYSVSIPYYASVFVKVKADSKEQALEKAYEHADPGLCHLCSERVELCEASGDEADVEELP
jgi:hypothetical protein